MIIALITIAGIAFYVLKRTKLLKHLKTSKQ
jgi:hypothetical protein